MADYNPTISEVIDAATEDVKAELRSRAERSQKSAERLPGVNYGAQAAGRCETASSQPYPHFRNIIDRLITYHNRQSTNLHALLRALPQDLSYEAQQALYDLAKTSLGSIR